MTETATGTAMPPAGADAPESAHADGTSPVADTPPAEDSPHAEGEVAGGWQLGPAAARAYQDHLVPAIFDRLARRLVELAAIAPGERVLDVACGTGAVTRAAARRVGPDGEVVGVDVNDSMLAVAEASSDGIDLRQAEAVDLPFPDDRFDVVTCQQAVQFLPDPVAGLAEMRRVTAPGGRVVFSVLRGLAANPVYRVFHDALGTHVGADAAAMIGSPFAVGDGEVLRRMAEEAGLADVTVRIAIDEERFPSIAEFVTHEAASSPLSEELARLEPASRAALVDDLRERLAGQVDDLGLVFHNDTHVVTAIA